MPVRIQTDVPTIMYKAILNCDVCDKKCNIPQCKTIEKALSISCLKGWVEDSDSVLYCPECVERKRELGMKSKDCQWCIHFRKEDDYRGWCKQRHFTFMLCHSRVHPCGCTFYTECLCLKCGNECGINSVKECKQFVPQQNASHTFDNYDILPDDGWIKTQDKLPPIGSKIKAKYDNGTITGGKVRRVILDRSYRKGSIVVGYDGESSRYHITHWKPLKEKQVPTGTCDNCALRRDNLKCCGDNFWVESLDFYGTRISVCENWKAIPKKTFELEKCYCHSHCYQLRYDNSLYCLAEMDSIDARGLCDWLNMIMETLQ